jgi:hypothetical protein
VFVRAAFKEWAVIVDALDRFLAALDDAVATRCS